MEFVARPLFYFAVFYAVYAVSPFLLPSSGPAEIAKLIKHVPQGPLFAPVRFVVWLVILPVESRLSALVLAFMAFCISVLLMTFR